MIRFAGWRIIFIGVVLAVVCAGGAWALVQQLPPTAGSAGQVNSTDVTAGIDATKSVSGEDPTNADVVGGALTAGKVAVPWAIFRQQESPPGTGQDQVFVRSFAGGAWTTRGTGTVGGSSSGDPAFGGSLNFDQSQNGETPAIDFAGAGRTVPWATWYESTTGTNFLGADNIFASRFDGTGDTNNNKWLFEGQGRGNGGDNNVPVPSLNIHTNRDGVNPSVAGGATSTAAAPVPWVTWQERDGASNGPQQIFVSKAVKPTTAPACPLDGLVNPTKPVGATGAIGTFCWQQVGIERLPSGAGALPAVSTDPTLNVDPTRDGIEPDIAFTGTNDTVPWVVWYESSTESPAHPSGLGLNNNEMVFAAKGTGSAAADGQFQWTAVGGGLQGLLDASALTAPVHHLGVCAESVANEEACSLNKSGTANAEDPRVAAGTMVANAPTVPWVVWDENTGTSTQIFVSRLVGTGAAAKFELANNGSPISLAANPSTRPDITFSGNTPYVSWRENTGGSTDKGFLGHFVLDGSGAPIFQLDESNIPLTPDAQADVRLPISSGCTANPFNADGLVCQGATPTSTVGTPFALFTNGSPTLSLFADAYQADAPVTGTASSVTASTATVSGSDNPEGAPVNVSFNFGTTTAYGQTTAAQKLSPANAGTPFAANLSALPAATTIHYQAVVTTDFGTVLGGDQTLTTSAAADKTPPKVSAKIVKSTIKKLLKSGKLKVKVTINEAGKVSLSASTKIKAKHHKHKTVKLGSAKATFSKAGSKTVKITVPSSAAGKLHALKSGAKITVSFFGTDTAGNKSKRKTASAVFSRK
jgi:hypothetical protein